MKASNIDELNVTRPTAIAIVFKECGKREL